MTGPSKIVCSLLEAGLDGGGQSCAWELLRKLDQIGSRTVGVLTKSDFAPKSGGSSAMRDNIQRIMAQYPLANGYYAVMCPTFCALQLLPMLHTTSSWLSTHVHAAVNTMPITGAHFAAHRQKLELLNL